MGRREKSGPGVLTVLLATGFFIFLGCCGIGIVGLLNMPPRPQGTSGSAITQSAKPDQNPNEFEQGGLVILRDTLQAKDTITGTIVNKRKSTLSYAEVIFNLYDESGAQVGTAIANTNQLEAGGRWSFTAVPLTDQPWKTYKIGKLSGL